MSGFSLKSAVFDMDGTLLDTERLVRRVWVEQSAGMGWPQVGQQYMEFVGRNHDDILRRMEALFGPAFPGEDFLLACARREHTVIEAEGVPMKPGARELLAFLQARGIPIALATSTDGARTFHRIDRAGLRPFFRAVVTGDDVSRSKPDPEVFLTACARLGADPSSTLAVEDSPTGVKSALAAGTRVAIVPDLIPPTPELEALAWKKFDTLLELKACLETVL